MARVINPTVEQEAGYAAWVAERPDAVRVVAEQFDPWSLYRLKTSGHRVTIVSFGEKEGGGVSLTVNVSGAFNAVMFERNVFGIEPDDLEPCELPKPEEPVGSMLSHDEVDQHIDALRAMAGVSVKH